MALLIGLSYERLRTYIPHLVRPVPPNRTEEVGSALLVLLKEKKDDVQVVRDIVNILGEIRYAKAIPKLIDLAKEEATPSGVKRACVNSLRFFSTEESIQAFMTFLGLRLTSHDKWVRQLAAQNLTTLIRRLKRDNPTASRKYVNELRHHLLNSPNTYTRMNAAIVLRLLGDKEAIPALEDRLKKEKELLDKKTDSAAGIPYVIREIEKTISYLTSVHAGEME